MKQHFAFLAYVLLFRKCICKIGRVMPNIIEPNCMRNGAEKPLLGNHTSPYTVAGFCCTHSDERTIHVRRCQKMRIRISDDLTSRRGIPYIQLRQTLYITNKQGSPTY
jgi:hypothetical protein